MARFGLLFASLCAAMLLLVLLDPFLPGIDRPPEMQSDAFHHVSRPGVWTAQQYGEWGPHLVYIDAEGWREAPPAAANEASQPVNLSGDRPRSAGEHFRMAVMGDSFVEAIQVTWEDTFVARLQARSAGSAEVLNRGSSSYSPLLALVRWQRQVAHERPTHLLLLLCPNDVADDQRYTDSALHRGAPSGGEPHSGPEAHDVDQLIWRRPNPRPELRDAGRLYGVYRRWRGRASVATAPWRRGLLLDPDRPARRWREQNPKLTPLTDRYLRELAAVVRGAGVELTLSAVPSSWEFRDPALRAPELRVGPTFADNVAAWAAANGVRYVDLQPAFRESAARGHRLFFDLDGHFTPAGHAVVAEVFAAAWPELFAPADPLPVRGPSGPLPP